MSDPMLNATKNRTRQSGVVLVTGLLFLLVVTIIALLPLVTARWA